MMKKAGKLGKQSSKEPPKELNWRKMTLYVSSIGTLSVAIHFQFLSTPSEDADLPQQSHLLEPEHSYTANVLFCSSLSRIAYLLLNFKLCHNKSLPKRIQPYMHYATMSTAFLFCVIAMWRLLVDSEPPGMVSYYAYVLLILVDLAFIVLEFGFSYYIVTNSGALSEEQEVDAESQAKGGAKKKKSKKDEKSERTVPFFVMLKKLAKWYQGEWMGLLGGYILLAVGTTATSMEPYFNSKIIDAINTDKVMEVLPTAVLVYSICALVHRLTMSVRLYMAEMVGARVSLKAKTELYNNVLSQEVGFFDETKSGDILRRLGGFSSEMEQVWRTLERTITTVLELVGLVVVMMKMSWRLSIILLMGNFVLWLPSNILRQFYEKQWKTTDKVSTELSTITSEAVRNIRTVKSFANEGLEKAKFQGKLQELFDLDQKDQLVSPVMTAIERISWLGVRAAILLYGGHLIKTGQLTPGELVTFLLYMGQMWGKVSHLIEWQAKRFFKMMLKMETFFEYMERKSKVDTTGIQQTENLKGKIEFKGVSFKYPTRPESNVLKSISFTAEAGQVVALVGSSGGGKSTCVNLIERFYDPESGVITLDDKPLQEYDNKFLHEQLSLVSQEPVLFGGSIEKNIKYGSPDASFEDIVKVAKQANAHDFITQLDDGYNTDVGESGTQMSGGQKQRIAIARALIRNPRIMLLDEATSALDTESESLVQEALQNSMVGRTVIIIAHRLSTVEHADKIVVLDKGTVVEQGSHYNLISRKGVYSRLVRRQMKKAKPIRIEELMRENATDEDSSSQTSDSNSRRGSVDEGAAW